MDNFYFTYWIARYGRQNLERLYKKVCRKITVPLKIKKEIGTDDFLFHYFYIVYFTVALHHFGLDLKQISLIMNMSLALGSHKLFSPAEILKVQQDVIPELIPFIEKDLKIFENEKI